MDPSKIDHERQARVSAERAEAREYEAAKRDAMYEIVDLRTEIADLRDVLGPKHERILNDGLDRLARIIEKRL